MERYEAARNYRDRGWRVVPLHHLEPDGQCSCGVTSTGHDRQRGKHPRLTDWPNVELTAADLATWFAEGDANVGLATGLPSGFVVVDLDDGLTPADLPMLPPTYTVSSGNGHHLYYLAPDHETSNAARTIKHEGRVLEGVDYRGDGGQVVAPPSTHYSGATYRVVADLELAPLPEWIADQVSVTPAAEAAPVTLGDRPDLELAASYSLEEALAVAAQLGDGLEPRHAAWLKLERERLLGAAAAVPSEEGSGWNATLNQLALEYAGLTSSTPPLVTVAEAEAFAGLLARTMRGVWHGSHSSYWQQDASACRATISSAVGAGQRRPRTNLPAPVTTLALRRGAGVAPCMDPYSTVGDGLGELEVVDRFAVCHGDDLVLLDGSKAPLVFDHGRGSWAHDGHFYATGRLLRGFATSFGERCNLAASRESNDSTAKWLASKGKLTAAIRGSAGKLNQLAKAVPGTLQPVPHELLYSGEVIDADGVAHRMSRVVNTPAGLVSLETGEVLEPVAHVLGDVSIARPLIMRRTMVAPDPASLPGSEWLRYVQWKLETPERAAALQRVLGASLLGSEFQRVFYVVGTAGSGKSTVINACAQVLGSYSAPIDKSLLSGRQRSSSDEYKVADLIGVRMATAGEGEQGAMLRADFVKELTGSDPMIGRPIREAPIRFRPEANVVVSSQFAPSYMGGDSGLARRLLFLEMHRTEHLPGTGSIPQDLESHLVAHEGGAILAWLLEGARLYLECGLDGVADVVDPTSAIEASDDVAAFLAECVELREGAATVRHSVQLAYRAWVRRQPVDKPLGRNMFYRRLRELLESRNVEEAQLGVAGTDSRPWRFVGMRLTDAAWRELEDYLLGEPREARPEPDAVLEAGEWRLERRMHKPAPTGRTY